MNHTEIGNGIYWIGVHDYTTYLFEGMWPIDQEGINYNAYVVVDEKIALIDTVKSIKTDEYLANIKSVIGDRTPDYLIINHMEPDHSSSIAEVVAEYPDIQIIGNAKTFPIMKNFYGVDTNLLEVENGGTLDLGGRTLQFYMTPMVHWPESMVTFDTSTGTLFSMDVFGSYKATVGSIFDDENDIEAFEFPTYRYYATIVGKVTEMAKRSLNALAPLDIKVVCPSHGLVWRTHMNYLLDLWTRLANAETYPGVVIVYGTMYGNTRQSAEIIADQLKKDGVKKVIMYDVGVTNISYILADIWKYQGLIMGAPAYYGQIFPPMQNLLYKLSGNKVRNHICAFFTEYSWSGGAERFFQEFMDKTGAVVTADIVKVQGAPDKNDTIALKTLAKSVAMEIGKN